MVDGTLVLVVVAVLGSILVQGEWRILGGVGPTTLAAEVSAGGWLVRITSGGWPLPDWPEGWIGGVLDSGKPEGGRAGTDEGMAIRGVSVVDKRVTTVAWILREKMAGAAEYPLAGYSVTTSPVDAQTNTVVFTAVHWHGRMESHLHSAGGSVVRPTAPAPGEFPFDPGGMKTGFISGCGTTHMWPVDSAFDLLTTVYVYVMDNGMFDPLRGGRKLMTSTITAALLLWLLSDVCARNDSFRSWYASARTKHQHLGRRGVRDFHQAPTMRLLPPPPLRFFPTREENSTTLPQCVSFPLLSASLCF